ncbi:MAG: GNAT family N-acetyltransferase [Bacteroidota bacterium]
MEIIISHDKSEITPIELLEIYASIGWAKKDNPNAFENMSIILQNTTDFVSARDTSGKLIGIVKILSDKLVYTTVAEILVVPHLQKSGIGKKMMERVKEIYGYTPIFIAAFDYNKGFFESCGYKSRPNMLVASKWFGRFPEPPENK